MERSQDDPKGPDQKEENIESFRDVNFLGTNFFYS